LTCEKLYLLNLEHRAMVDALMFAGFLYLFLGVIFDITSEIALYRRVRLGKTIIKYGINKATLLEKETRAYQHCISAVISIVGLIYSVLALFIQTSQLCLTLGVTIPHAVGLVFIGYWKCVLRFDENDYRVFPYRISWSFIVLEVLLFLYPFFILLLSLGLTMGEVQRILDISIAVSFLINIVVLTFTNLLGEWLFGVATLSEAVPENFTNPFLIGTLFAATLIFYRSLIGVNMFAAAVSVTTLIYITLFLVGRRRRSF
jgi:hypothetical protein